MVTDKSAVPLVKKRKAYYSSAGPNSTSQNLVLEDVLQLQLTLMTVLPRASVFAQILHSSEKNMSFIGLLRTKLCH